MIWICEECGNYSGHVILPVAENKRKSFCPTCRKLTSQRIGSEDELKKKKK